MTGTHVMRTGFRTVDGLTIRYADTGPGPGDDTVLLTNPWPESLHAFRGIWAGLAEHARLVAVDLPGFGHSERRDALLTPRAMAGFLLRLVEDLGLGTPHVIAPDVGTSAALFAAATRPAALRSLLVGSGGAAYPLQVTGALADIIAAPDLSGYRALDARQVVGGALSDMDGDLLPDDVRGDYLDSYAGDRFAESMRYVRSYPDELPVLAELLPGIETPVQIVAGLHDALVPPSNAEYLHARLPHSTLDLVDAGHFVWEQAADRYGRIATNWVSGGYRALSTPRKGT